MKEGINKENWKIKGVSFWSDKHGYLTTALLFGWPSVQHISWGELRAGFLVLAIVSVESGDEEFDNKGLCNSS